MNFLFFCTIIAPHPSSLKLFRRQTRSCCRYRLKTSFSRKERGGRVFIRDKGIIYNDHLRTSDKVATTFPLNPSLTSKPVVSTGFIVADPSISFNNSRHKDYLVNRLSLSLRYWPLPPSPSCIVYLEWPPRKVHLPESQYEGIAHDGSSCVHLHRRDNAIKRASLPLQSRGNDSFFLLLSSFSLLPSIFVISLPPPLSLFSSSLPSNK